MKSHLVSILCISALFASQASATIVSGSVTGGRSLNQGGNFVKLTAPFTESDPDNTVGNTGSKTRISMDLMMARTSISLQI